MSRYIISITSQDRSGIIAGISEGIFALTGNVEAASQTVHQGYFAMIVLANFVEQTSEQEIQTSIMGTAGADLHVFATPYRETGEQKKKEGSSFIVTCIGPDQPGILNALSKFLASRRVNIDDLYCTVDENRFVVICEVSVPEDVDVFILQTDLATVGETGGFTITMQHENIFIETTRP